MRPVIQEEPTGCGIAAVANVPDKSYAEMKVIANSMGIDASDPSLWSDTDYVRRLLTAAGLHTSPRELPFRSWTALPDLALLSIRHHRGHGVDFWHWVVFRRLADRAVVLDSASYLAENIRTDFAAMQPKRFIELRVPQPGA